MVKIMPTVSQLKENQFFLVADNEIEQVDQVVSNERIVVVQNYFLKGVCLVVDQRFKK